MYCTFSLLNARGMLYMSYILPKQDPTCARATSQF